MDPSTIPRGFELVALLDAGFAVFEKGPETKPFAYSFVGIGRNAGRHDRRRNTGIGVTEFDKSLARLKAAAVQGYVPVMGAPRSNNWGMGQPYFLLAMEKERASAAEIAVKVISSAASLESELSRMAESGQDLVRKSPGTAGVYEKKVLFVPASHQDFVAVTRPLEPLAKARYRILRGGDVSAVARFLDESAQEGFELSMFTNLDGEYLSIVQKVTPAPSTPSQKTGEQQ